MNWNESEIIVSNGIRYLNQEASQRFFEEYKEIFLQNNCTSVKCLKEEFCINLLKRLKVIPTESEVEVSILPETSENDDAGKEENESEEEVVEDITKIVDNANAPFYMLISSEFEAYLEREKIKEEEVKSSDIAKFVVGLNDNTEFYGKSFPKEEMELIGSLLAHMYNVNFDKKDISKLVSERIAMRKSQEESAKKASSVSSTNDDERLLQEIRRIEEEKALKERISNDLKTVIIDCDEDYDKIVEVCNLAINSKEYTNEEVAKILFYVLGTHVDIDNEKELNQIIEEFEYSGLRCLPELKNIVEDYINDDEDLDKDEDEDLDKEETKFGIIKRRKPTTKEDKKKVIYSLISGAGIISAILLTFVAKHNPIDVVMSCGTTFKALFTNNATLLDLASRLGDLTLYFGSIIAGWVGTNKLTKLLEKTQDNHEVEEEIIDINRLNQDENSSVIEEANKADLSLEEQDALKLAALFASEEDEDKKVK